MDAVAGAEFVATLKSRTAAKDAVPHLETLQLIVTVPMITLSKETHEHKVRIYIVFVRTALLILHVIIHTNT